MATTNKILDKSTIQLLIALSTNLAGLALVLVAKGSWADPTMVCQVCQMGLGMVAVPAWCRTKE